MKTDFEKCDFHKHNQIANELVTGATQFMLPETSARDNRRKVAEEAKERGHFTSGHFRNMNV